MNSTIKKIVLIILGVVFFFMMNTIFVKNMTDKEVENEQEYQAQNAGPQRNQETIIDSDELRLAKTVQTEEFPPVQTQEQEGISQEQQPEMVVESPEPQTIENAEVDHAISGSGISDYLVIRKDISHEGITYTAIRSFTQDEKEKLLVVNLQTNKTRVISVQNTIDLNTNIAFQQSAYKQALYGLSGQSGIANKGLKNDLTNTSNAVYMTADFCPSRKQDFEKEFIKKFMSEGNKNIAIAITNAWIEGHPNGFAWLRQQKNSGALNITWVNHTDEHRYVFNIPLANNFLLLPGTNLDDEVLDVEKKLLSYGETPSVFIRFPGLVSSSQIRTEMIEKYGLIFIGSDAWLAKGEQPQDGSIILVHGNKNEPTGIVRAHQYLDKIKDENLDVHFGDIVDSI